jgi:hypothetical protein
MLYAIFLNADSGYSYETKFAKEKLIYGKKYEVEEVCMGQSYTDIVLKDIQGAFSSVHFLFVDETGQSVDIYRDPRYNPYI